MSRFGTVYEAPERLLSLAVDGEMTLAGARSAIAAPYSLTPKELDGMKARLKRAAGDRPITNAMVDVATDPWVWFFFLTTPVGGASVSTGWHKVGRAVSPYVRRNAGVGTVLGALTPLQQLRGTPVGAAVFRIEEATEEIMRKQYAVGFEDALDDVVKRNGLDSKKRLLWELYAPGSTERQRAREIATLLDASLGRYGQANVDRRVVALSKRDVSRLAKRGITAQAGLGSMDVTIPRITRANPDNLLARYPGAMHLRDRARDMLDGAGKDMVPDGAAWLRVFRGLAEKRSLPGTDSPQTAKLARNVLRGWNRAPDKKAYESHLGQVMQEAYLQNRGHYNPRSVFEVWEAGPSPRRVDAEEVHGTRVFSAGVQPFAGVRGRQAAFPLTHPDDLRFIDSMLGLTGDGVKLLTDADKALAKVGSPVRLSRLDFQRRMQRYFNGARRTYAMFTADVGDGVRAVNKATRSNEGLAGTSVQYGLGSKGSAADPIELLEKQGRAPAGGFSLADVLGVEARTASPHIGRLIRDVVVPHATGTVRTEYALAAAAVSHARTMTAAFLDTPVAPAIESAGRFGKRFVAEMQAFAAGDAQDAARQGAKGVRGLTSLLYTSHLGLNASSAIINSTQPFLHAGSWLGYSNVLAGYKDAFGDLGRYFNTRIRRHGFAALSKSDRDALIEQTMPLRDVVGISSDLIDNLERATFAGEIARRAKPTLGRRIFFEIPMKLFEKAEWMNRLVTAHAFKRKWLSEGRDALDPLFVPTAREVVLESQFGGHWANTLAAALPGSQSSLAILKNPLIRQFLSFQVRSLTAATYTASRLNVGGVQGQGLGSLEGLGAAAYYAARAMGMSAMGIYLARDLIGADMERAGFAAAVSDVLPFVRGGRYDPNESLIPEPPIATVIQDLLVGVPLGDKAFLRDVVPKLLPGGLALRRAAEAVLPVQTGFQSTFADWQNRKEGEDGETVVPVYSKDGSLIGYESALNLILRGVGVDLGRHGRAVEVERAMLAGRDQAREYYRKAVDGLLAGDHAGYERARLEFERRFGVKMVISQDRLQRAVEQRQVSRTERISQQLEPGVRAAYANAFAGDIAARSGLARQQFEAGNTINNRRPEERVVLPGAPASRSEAFSGYQGF